MPCNRETVIRNERSAIKASLGGFSTADTNYLSPDVIACLSDAGTFILGQVDGPKLMKQGSPG